MERLKELFFTKNTYIGTGYPQPIDRDSGYFKGAQGVAAIGGDVTLVFVPLEVKLDRIKVYLTAADAYELGKLLMERAEVASQELLETKLNERGIR